MASRSFKPAQYLSSPKLKGRPSCTRSYSSSSTHSNKSDDGYIGSLIGLQLERKDQEDKVQTDDSPGSSSTTLHDTPGRKRSDPIAIRAPTTTRERVYTPLTAREEKPGGYFPDHEPSSPFLKGRYQNERSPTPSPTNMHSTISSHFSDALPRVHRPLLSPDLVMIPMGKYHPSNYKLTSPLQTSSESDGLMELQLPSNRRLGKRGREEGRDRKTNEVQSKVERYQRDMVAQARMLTSRQMDGADVVIPVTSGSMRGAPTGTKHLGAVTGAGVRVDGKWLPLNKPISPKLEPLGSPGPITPFELEELSEGGYLVARGTLGRSEAEVVSDLIRSECGK